MADLDAPMRQAMELAWTAFSVGSLAIGAVITSGETTVSTGRNRLAESDPGDDVLAGTSMAHAELNALAKLRFGAFGEEPLVLWTTLQPCVQCLGAIRMSPVTHVHVLAPDPLFRGVERMRSLTPFIAHNWAPIVERQADEWSVLSVVLQLHALIFWNSPALALWNDPLPQCTLLARRLLSNNTLMDLAASKASLDAAVAATWSQLGSLVDEVQALQAVEPPE
jgi:tRNA(Arg) A34 adenosine deaminase TadA